MKSRALSIVFLFAAFFPLVGAVYAGGCCYQYFNSVNGVAGLEDAQISVGFVDPSDIPSPLASQRIEVHIVSAVSGQFCRTQSAKTDDQGRIEIRCASPVPGNMSMYFTAPDLGVQANEAIKSVSKTITFVANPNAPMVSTVPSVTSAPSTEATTPYDAELEQRIDSLENKVQAQEKEVSRLQEIIDAILDFFKKWFQ